MILPVSATEKEPSEVTFNGERLRLLRQFHELTQSELAKRVAVSQAAIADYEKPRKEPTAEVEKALASVLQVLPGFFHEHSDDLFLEDEYNFRRRRTATERLKNKVAAQASLFGIVVRRLRSEVALPPLNFPSFQGGSEDAIEEAAEKSRIHWGLGIDVPIDNMTRVLEHAGVVTAVAEEETAEKIDAFSRFGETSVVVLNWAKGSTSRSFFDAAHETGHGVLHHRGPRKSLEEREKEADWFAGAFLMPRKAFANDYWAGGGMRWENLLELKRRWGASVQAIVVRAYQLCLMDPSVYRQTFRELTKRGWRTAEPEEPQQESPELFAAGLARLNRTSRDFARELHMTPTLFYKLTRVPMIADGEGISSIEDYIQRREARRW